MPSPSNLILILGFGPRVGAGVADRFHAKGYKVAVSSRKGTGTMTDQGYFSIKADFNDLESISAVFDSVKSQFGIVPNVVVYNAAIRSPPPDETSAFSLPVESVVSDLNINAIGAYAAAQQAVSGWDNSSKDGNDNRKKSFIFTGNMLNKVVPPMPPVLTLGMGKAAAAFWIGLADATYTGRGYRFFYADERCADGKPIAQSIDGPAHGKFYQQLASQEQWIPWEATFVKGKGYVSFS